MRWSALVIVGVTTLLAACQQTTRREAIADLRPRLSAIRNDLVALVPNLPDAGTVKAARIPEDALELDAQDATRDNTIIIGLAALRDPYDARKDDLLEVGFAYQHRFLSCLRDASDGSTTGGARALDGYRSGCERAVAARYALLYRVAKHRPARFEPPKAGANDELLFEPGDITVEWFVVDLGPPEARAVTLVGELTTSARTPETLTISFDKGTELGLVDARRQAAEGLAKQIVTELSKQLIGKARHVAL